MNEQPTPPPFSGDEPTCVKCGNRGARTQYRRRQPLVLGPGDLDRLMGAEHLERECIRCDYRWAEAIIEQQPVEAGARAKETR